MLSFGAVLTIYYVNLASSNSQSELAGAMKLVLLAEFLLIQK